MFVLRRKCTTNAQWTDKGAFAVCCCDMLVLRLCLSLAILRVLCQESRDTTGKSPGKTPGFLRDFSGRGRKGNVQGEKPLCFGPHRLDLQAGQLWRDQESVKLTPK